MREKKENKNSRWVPSEEIKRMAQKIQYGKIEIDIVDGKPKQLKTTQQYKAIESAEE